jgi:hypothetical protein
MASSSSERPRRWALALALALMVVAAARAGRAADAAAPAADSAARRAATAKLVEGVDLLKKGQYDGALARFDEAYALVPSPNIHYDRGLAYVGLGRPVPALEAFDAFLAGAAQPPAGKREQAERHRVALLARVARVQIGSDPAGAELLVDGRSYGRAPLPRAIYLDPGRHELRARPPAGGADTVRAIDAAAGQDLQLTLALARAPAASAAPPSIAAAAGMARDDRARPVAVGAAGAAHDVPDDRVARPRDAALRSGPPAWTMAAAGAGVVLLGAGVTFGLLARHEGDALSDDSRRGVQSPPVTFDPGKQASGLRYQTLEIVCLGAGGIALAGSAVAFALERRRAPEGRAERRAAQRRAAWSLTGAPVVAPALAGARLEVSF